MKSSLSDNISLIIPAKNEAAGLESFLPTLVKTYPNFEVIVVNDGSTDDTASVAKRYGAQVITQPYSLGNGAAIKAGARRATKDFLLLMDADGQHRVTDIEKLIHKFEQGYDMVVGCRDRQSQASLFRSIGNRFYNFAASKITGQSVLDLTSGFRLVKKDKFIDYLYLLPNGFSYPTTITMAFFRSGLTVGYEPIIANPRIGKSHLHLWKDGIRFLIILYKMTILYSPLKVFLPFAALHFLAGMFNYAYTYFTQGRFTNMSALLLSASIFIFLMGLISEQITVLMYQHNASKPSLPPPSAASDHSYE